MFMDLYTVRQTLIDFEIWTLVTYRMYENCVNSFVDTSFRQQFTVGGCWFAVLYVSRITVHTCSDCRSFCWSKFPTWSSGSKAIALRTNTLNVLLNSLLRKVAPSSVKWSDQKCKGSFFVYLVTERRMTVTNFLGLEFYRYSRISRFTAVHHAWITWHCLR